MITLAEAKAMLGITDTSRDAQLEALIPAVTALIERYVGRAFSSANRDERFVGGTSTIALRFFPVTSITTVTDLYSGTVVDAEGYQVDGPTGLLRRRPYGMVWEPTGLGFPFTQPEGWPAKVQQPRWRVQYVGGAAAPADAKLAASDILASQLKGQGGMQAESDGDYSYTRDAGGLGLTTLAVSLLKPLRSTI